MTRKISVLIFGLCLPFQICLGQYDSTKKSDLAVLTDGVLHNLTSPLRWNKRGWQKAGQVMLVSATTSIVDIPVNQFWSKQNDLILDAINDFGYAYGKPYSALLFSGGFYLTGLVIKDSWTKETGIMLATALITSGLLESSLKPLTGRARPENLSGNYDFNPFDTDPKFHSFPSGHAAMAFTISFVMAKRINNKPIKIAFYSFAAATALCRLYSNAHWFSDVAFSGLASWFIASESVHYLYGKTTKKENKNTQLSFHTTVGGMTLKMRFN